MNTYLAYVYKDPDSSFGVSFPDLPGCYSAGESYDEAIENARISIREYAQAICDDGGDMPEPRTHDELASDASEMIEMAEAAFVIEVPLICVGRKRRVNISIDEKILAAIDQFAKAAGVSRSAFLAEVAMERIEDSLGVVRVTPSRRRSRRRAGSTAVPAW